MTEPEHGERKDCLDCHEYKIYDADAELWLHEESGHRFCADPELKDLSDGALRVARRKALYALQNAVDIHDRLNLGETGKYDESYTAGNLQGSIGASADMLADSIETELDRRGAEYRPRGEVMD